MYTERCDSHGMKIYVEQDSRGVMAKHVLLTNATRRPYQTIPAIPDGTQYDSERGYWLKAGKPVVLSDEFQKGGQVTKKCDMETGEDQKGE